MASGSRVSSHPAPPVTGVLEPAGALRDALVDAGRAEDRQRRADRILETEGAGHLVHDLPVRGDGRVASFESRPWRVDPVPLVLDSATFGWLAAAVSERMGALERVLADLYGPRTLVRDGTIPHPLLSATDRYRIHAIGATPRRWLTHYAVDVALDRDGAWWVVQDLTDAPPGLGYALLDRSVMARVVPEVLGSAGVAPLSRYTTAMRRALAAASPAPSPRIVLFSGGLDHPSYIDHSYLAVQMGVHLVEGADLVVRQRRVWLRTLDGLEPVDVLYRRLEDPTVDPLEVGAHGTVGVPGLLQAVRSGGVSLANAHGAGVLETPELAPFVETAIDRLAPRRLTLPRLDDPLTRLAQVTVGSACGLSMPSAAVVVRLFAVADERGVTVLPGGTGRVLNDGDDPRLPTACVAKDVWVLSGSRASVSAPRLPQVDLARSIPTRAADALYWTNRSAERAEAMARTARVVSARLDQDPGLTALDGGVWADRMTRVLAAIRRQPEPPTRVGDAAERSATLHRDLHALSLSVAHELGSLLTEATTVREYLSVTTGRVLAHFAELRGAILQGTSGVDELDAVLADSAAFAGLWHESTVRGPAWTIGDTGRRLERASIVLDLVGALAEGHTPSDADTAALEVLLAANESLVSYRRRHRSDVELDAALSLVLRDTTNPRSFASTVEQLAVHAKAAGWEDGVDLAERAVATLSLPLGQFLPAARAVVEEAGARLVARWFSAPVVVTPMRRWRARTERRGS